MSLYPESTTHEIFFDLPTSDFTHRLNIRHKPPRLKKAKTPALQPSGLHCTPTEQRRPRRSREDHLPKTGQSGLEVPDLKFSTAHSVPVEIHQSCHYRQAALPTTVCPISDASESLRSSSRPRTQSSRTESGPPWIICQILRTPNREPLNLRTMFSINNGIARPDLHFVFSFWKNDKAARSMLRTTALLDRSKIKISPDEVINGVRNLAHGDIFLQKEQLSFEDITDYLKLLKPREAEFSLAKTRKTLAETFPRAFLDMDDAKGIAAIQYLEEMEAERIRLLRKAADWFGINKDNWKIVLDHDSLAHEWVSNMETDERLVQDLYKKVWIDVRMWLSVKVLQKLRRDEIWAALALVNTLYPPYPAHMPEGILRDTAYAHRFTLFELVNQIQADGHTTCVSSFVNKNLGPRSGHSYADLTANIAKYLELAADMIEAGREVDNGGSITKVVRHEAARFRPGAARPQAILTPATPQVAGTPAAFFTAPATPGPGLLRTSGCEPQTPTHRPSHARNHSVASVGSKKVSFAEVSQPDVDKDLPPSPAPGASESGGPKDTHDDGEESVCGEGASTTSSNRPILRNLAASKSVMSLGGMVAELERKAEVGVAKARAELARREAEREEAVGRRVVVETKKGGRWQRFVAKATDVFLAPQLPTRTATGE